jgi:adenylyltransferase and sulfurtransferase
MNDSLITLSDLYCEGDAAISKCLLPHNMTVNCREYELIRSSGTPHVLLDVRDALQFDLCALDGAIHIPIQSLPNETDRILDLTDNASKPVYCICRRGIYSTHAVAILRNALASQQYSIFDVAGGYEAWRELVDPQFPKY